MLHRAAIPCVIAFALALPGAFPPSAFAAGEQPAPYDPYDMKKLNEAAASREKKGCLQDSCISASGAALGFDMIFNTKDVFLGFRYGQTLVRKGVIDLNADVFFYFRPFEKASFEQTGPTTYNQYRERRYITGAKVTQKFWMSESLGLYGGAGYGYTFGSFEGTDRPTHDRWTPHYCGGAFYSFAKMVNLEGGYQFTKIPHSPDHFIFASISCSFEALMPADTDKDKKPGGGDTNRRGLETPKPDAKDVFR